MSAKYYSVAQLSDRISETPEGFLVCEGVAIARAGDLLYAPGETPIESVDGQPVVITRSISAIKDPATIASFEGKPITLKHPDIINNPDGFVTPENWKALAVGVVQNVRPGEGEDADKLLADLLITDADAIAAVKSKTLRELSCGYEANYVEESPGHGRQEDIIGNHVALVDAGRCGSEVAIFDHAPKRGTYIMTLTERAAKLKETVMRVLDSSLKEGTTTSKDAVKAAVTKAVDEAMPEATAKDDEGKALDEIVKRLDALEKGEKPGTATDDDPLEAIMQRLDVLEKAVAKLLGVEETAQAGLADKTGDAAMCTDADTIARAEILAPGIAKTADVKAKALGAALKTEDGKKVITTLLGGKTFDAADKDLLFVAASEMLKGTRREQLAAAATLTIDKLPSLKAGDMTPEKINEKNAAHYGKK